MIRSTFSSFTTATLALQANQRALDVVGQNIANINTEGYTRQRVDLVSFNLNGSSYANPVVNTNVGYGVQISGISQLRDPFLDIQYRNQIPKVATADAKQSALDMLADIFDETDSEGIKHSIEMLRSSINDMNLSVNSESDTIIRARCQTLINLISVKATEQKDVREDITSNLENTYIPDVNNLLKDISELNQSIWNSQVLGNPALELQDQRNTKLDTLASYLPIRVTYKDVAISSDTTLSWPQVSFVGADGTKHDLINGNNGESYASLSYNKVDDKHVSISLQPAGTTSPDDVKDITNNLKNGTLEGCIQMLNQSADLDRPPTDTRGLGYYEQTFNAFVDTFAKTMNSLNSYDVLDADGNLLETVKQPLFTVAGGSVDADGNVLDASGNPAKFTADTISINPDWMNGKVSIVTSQTVKQGDTSTSTATDNLARMIAALDDQTRSFTVEIPVLDADGNPSTDVDGKPITISHEYFKGNFSQCYANLENVMGIDSKSNKSSLETHIAVVQKTMDNRDALSGVSMDEEGISILQYQRSYSAASRLMTALDQMLDTLINSTGVVGR